MADADNEPIEEQIQSVEESIDDVVIASCRDVESVLSSVQNEEERRALIFELQHKRLRYARYHVEKMSLLNALKSEDIEIALPKWNKSGAGASTSYIVNVQETSTSELPFRRGIIHRTSRCSVKIRRTSDGSDTARQQRQRRGTSDDDDCKTASESSDDENASKIKKAKDVGSEYNKGATRRSFIIRQKANADDCDSTADPLQFILHELPDAILAETDGVQLPFDHCDETEVTTRVEEIILLGEGEGAETNGSFGNATIDRRERILNERHAAGCEIRFVHEHTRTYRLETVVHVNEDGLRKWAERVVAQRNQMQLPKRQFNTVSSSTKENQNRNWSNVFQNDVHEIIEQTHVVDEKLSPCDLRVQQENQHQKNVLREEKNEEIGISSATEVIGGESKATDFEPMLSQSVIYEVKTTSCSPTDDKLYSSQSDYKAYSQTQTDIDEASFGGFTVQTLRPQSEDSLTAQYVIQSHDNILNEVTRSSKNDNEVKVLNSTEIASCIEKSNSDVCRKLQRVSSIEINQNKHAAIKTEKEVYHTTIQSEKIQTVPLQLSQEDKTFPSLKPDYVSQKIDLLNVDRTQGTRSRVACDTAISSKEYSLLDQINETYELERQSSLQNAGEKIGELENNITRKEQIRAINFSQSNEEEFELHNVDNGEDDVDTQPPNWIHMADNMHTTKQTQPYSINSHLEISNVNVAGSLSQKASQVSLCLIMEKEEEEEHEIMLPRTSAATYDEKLNHEKCVSFRDITILHWLDPVPELPYYSLESSQLPTTSTDENSTIRSMQSDNNRKSCSSRQYQTINETINESRIQEISKILERSVHLKKTQSESSGYGCTVINEVFKHTILNGANQITAADQSTDDILNAMSKAYLTERLSRLLLNVNTSGGLHTWHVPYFLVPREPELLPTTRMRRGSAGAVSAPTFLQVVSALLSRQEQLEGNIFGDVKAVQNEIRRETERASSHFESQNVKQIARRFEELSGTSLNEPTEIHWKNDYISNPVQKRLRSLRTSQKDNLTEADAAREAALAKELGAALAQRYRRLKDIERAEAAVAKNSQFSTTPLIQSFGQSESKKRPSPSSSQGKRSLDSAKSERPAQPPPNSPRVDAVHVDRKRSEYESDSEDENGADYSALTTYYIRSASSLFCRLDRDYRRRRERAKLPLAFTVRFAKPPAISLSGTRRRYLAGCMPELIDTLIAAAVQNGGDSSVDDTLCLAAPEENITRAWDATNLLNKLYHVDYNPLVEKRSRFRNMEGHLEIPKNEPDLIPEIENEWKKLYFRTKDGRFQWYATHFADEHPIEDILLTGTTVTANRNDWTITIKGGKEKADLIVKAPSNLFEKWIQALLSHSHSALIDAYVQPVYPPVAHFTHNVVLIELGSAAVRAGVLTNRPSLPQVFFPAVGCLLDSECAAAVGIDAFQPEIRQRGQLQSPIQASESDKLIERYRLNLPILSACLQKIINELSVHTHKYKVLLSIPQNIPSKHASELLRTLVRQIGFKAASIARQPSLILYSYDVTTGVVVDIGERFNIVPIIDEYIVESAIISLPFGAPQIRKSLQKELASRNQRIRAFNSAIEQLFLRHIVEQACYVAVDYEEETKRPSRGPTRIDFEKFKIGGGLKADFTVDPASAFGAPEGLFKPKRWGLEMRGIHQLIHDVIQQSPIDSRRTLYRNIYVAGGTSLLPGFCERLENEISKIAPPSIFVQVHGSPWRHHAAYLGSQVIANSFQFENCCADAHNLDEYIRQMENSA